MTWRHKQGGGRSIWAFVVLSDVGSGIQARLQHRIESRLSLGFGV